MTDQSRREEIRRHFEEQAARYDAYKLHSRYYYAQLKQLYGELAPNAQEASVLELGCGTGEILASLHPARGLGIDLSDEMIRLAREKFAGEPSLQFAVAEAESLTVEQGFDYVIIPDAIEHFFDPQAALLKAAAALADRGTLILSLANARWTTALHALEKLHLKMPEGPHQWLPEPVIEELCRKACLTITARGYRCLIPARLPIIADAVNGSFYRRPWLARWGLINFFVCTRLQPKQTDATKNPSLHS